MSAYSLGTTHAALADAATWLRHFDNDDRTTLILSEDRQYTELHDMTRLRTFVTSLAGHAAVEAARQQ